MWLGHCSLPYQSMAAGWMPPIATYPRPQKETGVGCGTPLKATVLRRFKSLNYGVFGCFWTLILGTSRWFENTECLQAMILRYSKQLEASLEDSCPVAVLQSPAYLIVLGTTWTRWPSSGLKKKSKQWTLRAFSKVGIPPSNLSQAATYRKHVRAFKTGSTQRWPWPSQTSLPIQPNPKKNARPRR